MFEASWRKYHAGTEYVAGCTTSANALYEVAANAANTIMTQSPYSLYVSTKNGDGSKGDGRGTYGDLFTSEKTDGNPEVMLAYEITAPSVGEANWRLNSSSYGSHLCLSRIFAQSFLNLDGTFYNEKNADGSYKTFVEECAGRDYRLSQIIRGPEYTWKVNGVYTRQSANFSSHTYTGYQFTKFVYDDQAYDDQSSGTYDDPLFRFAEVLLIYAEAKAELGTITATDWANTIGKLRARAGITGGLNTLPTEADPLLVKMYGNLSPVVLEVRRERTIELMLEGHRKWDLKRWGRGSNWQEMPWEGVYVPAMNTALDMNGDGVNETYFTDVAPGEWGDKLGDNATIAVELTANKTLKKLADDPNGGYVMEYVAPNKRIWEDKMYLYPIPTQVGIMNYVTANAAYALGAKRIVLARETSLEDIIEIREKTPKDLDIEAFVHGAMCMSFSGRCLLSQYLNGRDANRGECSQPCRWQYQLVEKKRPDLYFDINETEEGTYIMNANDLCMAPYVDMLAKAGNKELTTKVSDYLMLSVYRMFRKLYQSEKKNSQSMFKVSGQIYESYALSAMEKVSADINVLLTDKTVTKQIGEAFEMTSESMAKEYPKHTTGLLNTVKTAEEIIK